MKRGPRLAALAPARRTPTLAGARALGAEETASPLGTSGAIHDSLVRIAPGATVELRGRGR